MYLKVSLEISRVEEDLLRSLGKERCSQGVCFPGEKSIKDPRAPFTGKTRLYDEK